MSNKKILYVCQEISPYLPETDLSTSTNSLLAAMYERGFETRTFMPCYGVINERRNQLHEVIRLSGMNIIIGEDDHQLIIKVASLPSVRAQVYFIDNDDYFSRKGVLLDENGEDFHDNGQRAIFFARGVMETIKKLQWKPDIIDCHGWFSAIVPLYLKNSFAQEPLFKESKIVLSLYDGFRGVLNDDFASQLIKEGVDANNAEILERASYQNLIKFVIENVDGVAIKTPSIDDELMKIINSSAKSVMPYSETKECEYFDNCKSFYEEL